MTLRAFSFISILFFGVVLTGCSNNPKTQPPPPQNVQLAVTVTGSGTVTSSPSGINCPSTCTGSFPSGTSVTLAATAGTNSQFTGFGGACSGTSCQLMLKGNQSVSATFSAAGAGPQLTVSVAGQGTVTSSPAGINCPTTCAATFSSGASVSLTATPASGNSFSGFGGACSGTSCQLALTSGQNETVTATFGQAQNLNAINHIIVLLQENRSFDHYLGQLMQYWQAHNYPQATNGTTFDGLPANASNPDHAGTPTSAFNLQTVCTENPSPSWVEAHLSRNYENPTDSNNALMDGFAREAGGDAIANNLYDVLGHRAMGYYVGDGQLNYYYFMASNFATSDRWFAPVLARTQVNRMYLYGATSEGHAFPRPSGSGALSGETIFQDMQDHNVSWKIYVHPDSSGCTTASCLEPHSYLSQWTYGNFALNNFPEQFATTSQLISDMQSGQLPQVSFIEPAGYVGLDEHPGTDDSQPAPNIQAGAAYVASIVNALMASPSWKDSVFIFTYDEPGGFYDHVAPQPATPPDALNFPTDLAGNSTICANDTSDKICGFYYTGFRVPLVVISPFAKKNYVSHLTMDYTAILKLIETRFSIPNLTARDNSEPDMSAEFLDFVNVPWATPPSNVPPQATGMQCTLQALSGITFSPNPAPIAGQVTVTLNLSHPTPANVVVSLSADSSGVVPPNETIAANTSSTSFTVNVPVGVTEVTVTGTIGGIPVSGTVPVQ